MISSSPSDSCFGFKTITIIGLRQRQKQPSNNSNHNKWKTTTKSAFTSQGSPKNIPMFAFQGQTAFQGPTTFQGQAPLSNGASQGAQHANGKTFPVHEPLLRRIGPSHYCFWKSSSQTRAAVLIRRMGCYWEPKLVATTPRSDGSYCLHCSLTRAFRYFISLNYFLTFKSIIPKWRAGYQSSNAYKYGNPNNYGAWHRG